MRGVPATLSAALACWCFFPAGGWAHGHDVSSRDTACVVLAEGDPLDLIADADGAEGSASALPEQAGPITTEEAALLVRDLQRVPVAGGWTIRAVRDGSRLSPQRTQALIGDVRSVLAELHGRELLNVLRKIPGISPEDLQALQDGVADIARCTADRFGSEAAYEKTVEVVRARRAELEAVVLEPVRRPVAPKSSPPPVVKTPKP
jgi:hypothetical protein